MELGVFIPIGSNGWLISTTSPQYLPSFDLNREVVQKAERLGFDFALSMIKLHGFGGSSVVRVALETPSGEQASAILPDGLFFAAPVRPGETATLVWSEQDVHYVQAG